MFLRNIKNLDISYITKCRSLILPVEIFDQVIHRKVVVLKTTDPPYLSSFDDLGAKPILFSINSPLSFCISPFYQHSSFGSVVYFNFNIVQIYKT